MLTTLWWYSASVWITVPSVASLVLSGRALSPALEDLDLHWLPDSRITGTTSHRVLDEPLGPTLRETYARVIPLLCELGGVKERPMWAIASDSLANRMLWLGQETGQLDGTTALARALADEVGRPLPRPRYVDVGPNRFTRRCSCCLLYEAPGQGKCRSCPRHAPDIRAALLTESTSEH